MSPGGQKSKCRVDVSQRNNYGGNDGGDDSDDGDDDDDDGDDDDDDDDNDDDDDGDDDDDDDDDGGGGGGGCNDDDDDDDDDAVLSLLIYHCRTLTLVPMSHSAPGVRCVLGFTFMADHYAGIIRLQDALFKEKLLYRMPTEAEYLTTGDGKRKFLLLFCV